jgi:mono/diheme cytochrome c family protein
MSLPLMLLLAGVAAAADPALERGRHVAERDCAACHAVGDSGASANLGAPPFRTIRLRYNTIGLEKRLATIPTRGHETMPPRALSASDVPDLVAYIESLGRRP